jgi:hypothetical protein
MRADDDQATFATRRRLGQYVAGRTLPGYGVDGEPHGGSAIGPSREVEGAAAFVCDADHRDRGGLAQHARKGVRSTLRALVHDHDADGASRNRILDFGLEWAGAAADQRHGAALETFEVGGGAAAGRCRRRSGAQAEFHRTQPRCHIT